MRSLLLIAALLTVFAAGSRNLTADDFLQSTDERKLRDEEPSQWCSVLFNVVRDKRRLKHLSFDKGMEDKMRKKYTKCPPKIEDEDGYKVVFDSYDPPKAGEKKEEDLTAATAILEPKTSHVACLRVCHGEIQAFKAASS